MASKVPSPSCTHVAAALSTPIFGTSSLILEARLARICSCCALVSCAARRRPAPTFSPRKASGSQFHLKHARCHSSPALNAQRAASSALPRLISAFAKRMHLATSRAKSVGLSVCLRRPLRTIDDLRADCPRFLRRRAKGAKLFECLVPRRGQSAKVCRCFDGDVLSGGYAGPGLECAFHARRPRSAVTFDCLPAANP